ncbi:hypothetical protein Taro_030628 [Colocasia esculenta]|uniref:Uncharacterized protein n=1 Tax=Colocasia esculenta TaxID=4460 RepID=A0A843VWP0_COLES|nr:hypothetical protein [Colocasia esculenta]
MGVLLLLLGVHRCIDRSWGSWQIAKTGSLCCVAARPHGSSPGSREWSMGHDEPFWQTNTSFSPPLSRRWEQRLQTGGLSYGSLGDGGITLSSLSSNSKESRAWIRGEQLPHHTYSTSDGAMSYLSSPSDIFQAQQLLPPVVQGVHIDEYVSATMREKRIIQKSISVNDTEMYEFAGYMVVRTPGDMLVLTRRGFTGVVVRSRRHFGCTTAFYRTFESSPYGWMMKRFDRKDVKTAVQVSTSSPPSRLLFSSSIPSSPVSGSPSTGIGADSDPRCLLSPPPIPRCFFLPRGPLPHSSASLSLLWSCLHLSLSLHRRKPPTAQNPIAGSPRTGEDLTGN